MSPTVTKHFERIEYTAVYQVTGVPDITVHRFRGDTVVIPAELTLSRSGADPTVYVTVHGRIRRIDGWPGSRTSYASLDALPDWAANIELPDWAADLRPATTTSEGTTP